MDGPSGRRRFLTILGGATVGVAGGCLTRDDAGSDAFPEEDILLVVPASPGGGFDVYARLVAEHVELPVRVENMSGAAGDIAKEHVYTAEPDGYTLMISSLGLYPPRQVTEDVPYDLSEMTYFPQIVDEPTAVGGAPGAVDGWHHFVELVNDEAVRFAGSPGGQTAFIFGTLGYIGDLWPVSHVFDNLVTLDGTAEFMTAIQRGDADALAGSVSSALPYVEADDYELWMANVDEPDASGIAGVPDGTPTLQSENVENASLIDDTITHARLLVGPPGIPEPRVNTLEDAFMAALESEGFRQAVEEAERPVQVLPGPETEEKALNTLDGLRELPFLDEMGRQ